MTPPAQNRSPLILLGLTRSTLARLLAPDAAADLPRIAAQLDAVADALVLGSDLVHDAGEHDPGIDGIDPTIAAITLAHHTSRVGLVVAAVPQRDHPYNIARRLASVDHASGGRAGLFIGSHDPRATAGSPWTRAAPEVAASDAVTAVRALWRSFPLDAIVADRESGVFAESHRIVAVDHRGAFDVTGPLQVPWSPQIWPPVLAWSTDGGALARVADVVVGQDNPLVAFRPAGTLDDLRRLLSEAPQLPPSPRRSLRARFGLAPADPPTGGRQVFPEPAVTVDGQRVAVHAR